VAFFVAKVVRGFTAASKLRAFVTWLGFKTEQQPSRSQGGNGVTAGWTYAVSCGSDLAAPTLRMPSHCWLRYGNGPRCPTLTARHHVYKSRHMDDGSTIMALSALAQPTRLAVFRLLISREPDGLPAGEIAETLGVPHNTMSTHLSILARAGLVTATRRSRSIVYQASLDQLRQMVTFLLKDCCGGRPEICAPLIAELNPCCQPKGGTRDVSAQE